MTASILEEYCIETEKLIREYSGDQTSSLAEGRVANIRKFLRDQNYLTRAGLFLFLGVYNLDDYKDAKTWDNLLSTQEAIVTHYINRARLKADYETCKQAFAQGVNPLLDMERKLMSKIKNFCQCSADPFFGDVLYSYVKECETREDILKSFASLRDETNTIHGEINTDAEEAFSELNEKMWEKLRLGIKEFFERPETLESFIDITSDTFNIPTSKILEATIQDATVKAFPSVNLYEISLFELKKKDPLLVKKHAKHETSIRSIKWDKARNIVVIEKNGKFRVYKIGAGKSPEIFKSAKKSYIITWLNKM